MGVSNDLMIGSLVHLRSGGSVMTVRDTAKVSGPGGKSLVSCSWMDKFDRLQEADFSREMLEKEHDQSEAGQ